MNANELRIGNYYNSHGTFKKATPSTIEELFESENRIWIQPVPITEEMLLKCGFSVEHTIGGWLKWQKGDFKLLDRKLPYPCRHNASIEYLHQLQNLYFALTGEELEINL